MNVTIEYEYDHNMEPHYFSKVKTADGTMAFRGGKSWNEARERMIKDLPSLFKCETPPFSETVEIGATTPKVWGGQLLGWTTQAGDE